MFRPYLRLLRTPGVALPFLCGFLGSLPISMLGLGVLLSVQSATGSFARAGLVSGALSVGNAIGLVLQGRMIDRYGQRLVLAVAGPCCGLCLLAFTVAVRWALPFPSLLALAALAGASIPAVITSLRIRLPDLVAGPARQAAYALLATEFQLAMIAGPLLVSALLLVSGPGIAVLLAGVLAAGAALVFTALPTSGEAGRLGRPGQPGRQRRPPPHDTGHGDRRRSARGGLGRLLTPGLRTLLVASFGGGVAAGLVGVAVPAIAVGYGAVSLSGVLFAAQSAGDLLGGLAYGGRVWRIPVAARLVRFQAAAVLTLGLLAIGSAAPPAMLWAMGAHGAVHAPAGVAGTTLLDDVVGKRSLGQAYTLMVASGLAGTAVGNALGGGLGGVADEWTLFLVALLVAAGVCGCTFARRRTLQHP